MKKVCIVGLGYIGLPTALIAAQSGFEVLGYDIDATRVERINAADPVIVEPSVHEQLLKVLATRSFRVSTVIEPADCFVIAVPTPCSEDKKADLTAVFHAATAIARVLKQGNTIIIESTVPVGTTQRIAQHLQQLTGLQVSKDIWCAYCPERVLPGKIFYELVHNPRVIGGISPADGSAAQRFYAHFVRGDLYITDASTAEMVKLVENSSRDVQIAFAHEVADMAYAAQLDPYTVINLANKHPRVSILQPRCGVGGHCIAIDPWFLIETFEAQAKLIQTARWINDEKPHLVCRRIQMAAGNKYSKLLLLGAAYKPDIDDLRESPAVVIAQWATQESRYQVRLCEPYITQQHVLMRNLPELIELEAGLAWADMVVCLVAHSPFKEQISRIKRHPLVLDFCGLLSASIAAEPSLCSTTHEATHNSAQQKEY